MVVRAINRLLALLDGAAAAFIIVMMLSTTANVIGRYLFSFPIVGTVELNRTLLVFTAFLALGYTQLKKQHIQVGFLLRRLSPSRRILIDGFESLFALVVMGFISYVFCVEAYTATVQGEYEIGLIAFPMWPGRIALALGCVMLCVQYLVEVVGSFRFFLGRSQKP